MENGFLVELTTIENAMFQYKTAVLKANVKINRMGSRKWTYNKDWVFGTNYFFFFFENLILV